MKTTLALAFLLLAVSAFGQSSGQMRTVTSKASLIARVPVAGERVAMSTAEGGVRFFTSTTNLPSGGTNLAHVFASGDTNQWWVSDDKENSVQNVQDYGAIGDGVTDDTAAWQAAAALATAGSTLYSPAGKTYLTTNTIYLTNDRVRLDLSGSTIKFNATTRKAAVSAGPAGAIVTGLDFALSTATNKATGVTAGTFAAGDMVMLYNDVEDPANYNPGQMAFITAASGTEITLDRFPDSSLQVTNAYRFVDTPDSVVIRNVVVDLSGATDGIGISAIGRGHLVENCRVIGTGTTNDPNYIGIELRGQSITARKNFVQGILDAGNAVDRSGYGIFATGDNIVVEDNELLDCKHCVSTSERKAISHNLKVTNNRIRQRDDWAGLTDVNGAYLFTGALDVHANVRHIEFRGNDVKIGGRYALSLRNGNFDVLFNRIEVTSQTLPFAQHTIGLAEELVERGLFHGNKFITADGATLLYFAQADSGVSGTHSNLSFVANSFQNCILSLDDFDTTAAVTNGFANTVISGNTFNRPGGTTLLFSGPSSNAIVTGNAFTHGGSGVSIAVPGDDTTNPAREIYIAGNTFSRTGGTSGDVRFLSGPTNIVELGNNRFSDVPTQGFDGQVAVSRTPPSSYRYQLITADDDELLFNSTAGTAAGRLRWGGAGAVMGYETEFFSYRLDATERAFSSGLPGHAQRDFVIKADGLMSWSDGTNAANIVLGPRRIEDLTNGVLRLSGGFGLTEHAEPITPSSTTATIWLEEADSSKSIKVKWPDGSNTALYPQAGGGTNASTVYVDGTQVDAPNFVTSAKFAPSVTGGTNVSFLPVAGSLQTNDVDATFHALLVAGGGAGDVVGPASSTTNNIAVFADATGKLLADGGVTVASLATEAEVAAAYQAKDTDLDDLADGSLTGSKVGSGIDDDNVSFDDGDSLWTATTIGSALEELNDSINSGVPNGTGAKLHWSQLLGVPAGFADGTDDGSGGGVTNETITLLPQNYQPPATSYASFGTRNSIGVLEFDSAAQESGRWVIVLPVGYTYTSGITVALEWSSSATSGDGRWGARVQKLSGVDMDSDSFDTAVEGTTTTSGTAGLINRTTLSSVGVDSAAAGDLVQIEIYRDVGDAADTINSNDLLLVAVRVQIP